MWKVQQINQSMVCLKSWVAAGVRRRSVGDLVGDLPGQEEEEAPVAVADFRSCIDVEASKLGLQLNDFSISVPKIPPNLVMY